MPDKNQNININYRVNTTEVDRARTTLASAQSVQDKFASSAKKIGDEGAKAMRNYQTSIGAVRADLERQKTLIDSTARSDVKLLNERIAKYKQLKREVEEFNKRLQETEKTTKSVGNSFADLGNIIQTALSLAAVKQFVRLSLEMATLAGNIDGVSRAFGRLPNSILLLDSLRKSTHGTVDDLQLMQKALQANNFKIPLQQLGTLFEFAATKAQQTGQEVNHLVDYIVSGIGYRSIKRLDDLGFTANRLRDALGGVSLQAATTAQVMEAVGKLMNEDLQKTGGYAETAATKVEQLGVAWVKFKTTVAQETSKDGGFVDFLKDLVESARLLVMGQKAVALEGVNDQSIQLAKDFIDSVASKDTAGRIEETQQKMNSLQQTIGRYNDMIAQTRKEAARGDGFGQPGFSEKNIEGARRWNELVAEYGKRAHSIFVREYEDAYKRLNALQVNKKVLEQTIVVLKQYFETLETAPPEAAESLGLIEAKLAEIEDAGDRLKTAKTTSEIHAINNELSRLNGELADLKAFGTTKQFLEVNGKLKLVPVVDPKGVQKAIEQEPIFKKGVIIPAKIGFTTGVRSAADSGAGGVQGSLTEQIEKQLAEALKNIPTPNVPVAITPMTTSERIGQEFADNWRGILSQGLSDTTMFFDAVVQAEAQEYEARIKQSQAYYDRLMILAGDNENAKDRLRLKSAKEEDKLRRQAFEADKRAKRASAIIGGATGIINAYATLPFPAAVVASALIAAEVAAQLAVINKQKPGFAKGVLNLQGRGSATSDSIDARLSKGESVMTAAETKSSFGVLKAVKARTLDDKVLEGLKVSASGVQVVNGMNDKRIVSKLDDIKNAIPDYAYQNGVLWKTRQRSDTYKQWVRAKTM